MLETAMAPFPCVGAARNEFDQTIQETEAAYMKVGAQWGSVLRGACTVQSILRNRS